MLGKQMRNIIISFIVLSSFSVMAEDFKALLSKLEKHQLVESRLDLASSISKESESAGSWGDPMLDVAAVNFPKDTLNRDASMMTGIRFGLSQSLSLSGKYGRLREAKLEDASSTKAAGIQLKRSFARALWEIAAKNQLLIETKSILEENLSWVKNNLKITKKLYATGKLPQQAVLDIQMRKSQLDSDLGNVRFLLQSLEQELSSLLGSEKVLTLNSSSVPWNYLNNWNKGQNKSDYREKELKHNLKAQDLKVSAARRNLLPDVKLGINYTKRNSIDGLGDFVGASITIPIPTSSKRYADKSQALLKKLAAEKSYRHYKLTKPRVLQKVELEVRDLENQLRILNKQTLKYAASSRDVIARSYARGGADYLELLHSELQYQNQRLKKVNLDTTLKNKKVEYLFLQGDDLLLGSL